LSLPTIEEQLGKSLKEKTMDINKKVGKDVAKLFEDEMKLNTQQGRGFGQDQYDSTYSPSHRKERQRRGLQPDRVDLRMKHRRIERTVVETTAGSNGSTTIKHAEHGDIFKLHHTGRAKGGKVRSIWPKSPESIPEKIKLRVKELVGEAMSGKK
jgi:hypothetical protein